MHGKHLGTCFGATTDDPNTDHESYLLVTKRLDSAQQENESTSKANINETSEDIYSTNSDIEETKLLINNAVKQVTPSSKFPCSNVPARYVIAAWAFFGFFSLFTLRVNLSLAIVAMVAPQSALNASIQSCPSSSGNSTTPSTKYEFDWSPKVQGIVLGAFFYGYITMQIIGGNLAEKFGAKWIFGGCVFIGGLLTLLTPLAARTHVGLLIAIRFLAGMVCGPGTPSATALWGRWIPPVERSIVPAASQTGANFGIIVTTPLTSVMIENKFLSGWPSAFYVFGTISCVWFIGWCFFSYSTPNQHPRISTEEREYLNQFKELREYKLSKRQNTPWREIMRCKPLYGITIMHVCNNYIYYTLLTSLPTYFATILNFNLQQNGFLFAIPYFGQFLSTIVFGSIADRIRKRKLVSMTVLRKAQTVLGTVGVCSFLVSIGYMGCNHVGAVVCCVLAVTCLGLFSSGALVSHLDVASNYAGTLYGITNTVGTIPGFVGPYVVGAITNNNQRIEAWRIIFNLSAGIGAFGCICYCILFNGEEQPWNRTPEGRERNESIVSVDT